MHAKQRKQLAGRTRTRRQPTTSRASWRRAGSGSGIRMSSRGGRVYVGMCAFVHLLHTNKIFVQLPGRSSGDFVRERHYSSMRACAGALDLQYLRPLDIEGRMPKYTALCFRCGGGHYARFLPL
jgi:hypothetical protein